MPTILIVDDEATIRLLIRRVLSLADSEYSFLEADDGVVGLQLAREHRPDLVLLDILMPTMNGLQVCKALKEEEQTRHIPVIMVTSQGQRALKSQAVDAGADDFLIKPFDSFDLRLRARSLLRIKQLHDALRDRYAESRERNQELEELGEWRTDLLHMIIHDMRSPLGNAQLALQFVLGESTTLDPMHRKTLEIAFSSVAQLAKMVNNILDISRIERGQLIMNRQPQDVPALIRKGIQELSSLAALDGKQLEVTVAEGTPLVEADADLLYRVITNLLDNAIRYSPQGSLISAAVAQAVDGQGLQISIHSPGAPIPAEAREAVFDKFRQFGDAPARKSGVGLGLAFCRMAVEAHGGQIWVESGEGEGNMFRFTLPAAGDRQKA